MTDLKNLDDYLFGVMPEDQVDAFEERLFERAAAGDALEAAFVDHIGMWGRYLAARAGVAMGNTKAYVDSLIARGYKVEIAEARLGQAFTPKWSEDAEIAVTRYDVDLRGHERLEAEVETPEGVHLKTFRDGEYDPADGAVYAGCEALLARKTNTVRSVLKLYALDGNKRTFLGAIESVPAA